MPISHLLVDRLLNQFNKYNDLYTKTSMDVERLVHNVDMYASEKFGTTHCFLSKCSMTHWKAENYMLKPATK